MSSCLTSDPLIPASCCSLENCLVDKCLLFVNWLRRLRGLRVNWLSFTKGQFLRRGQTHTKFSLSWTPAEPHTPFLLTCSDPNWDKCQVSWGQELCFSFLQPMWPGTSRTTL